VAGFVLSPRGDEFADNYQEKATLHTRVISRGRWGGHTAPYQPTKSPRESKSLWASFWW